jgi:uncharacterized membrane protein
MALTGRPIGQRQTVGKRGEELAVGLGRIWRMMMSAAAAADLAALRPMRIAKTPSPG